MMMAVWKFAPALAAGNTVVLKPSDTTPASSVWMVKKMQDIFPKGVANLVCGDRDTGAALVSHKIPRDGLDHRLHPGRHRGGDGGGGRRQGRPPRAGR